MKKGIVILGLISALGLSACGLSSSSDNADVIAQSKAVIEQSKAVVEESKAVQKAKGNSDNVEKTESVKSDNDSSVSHPFLTLEYENEKFDILNDTLKDWVYFQQKMKIYSVIDLGKQLEPYARWGYSLGGPTVDDVMGSMAIYNPYNTVITVSDSKIGNIGTSDPCLEFEEDGIGIPDNLKFLGGKVTKNSSREEWKKVIEEAATITFDDGYRTDFEFVLDNGRNVAISLYWWSPTDGLDEIEFHFECYYE